MSEMPQGNGFRDVGFLQGDSESVLDIGFRHRFVGGWHVNLTSAGSGEEPLWVFMSLPVLSEDLQCSIR